MAPAWSMKERMTPPKIVPCAFVSRGIMSTRMAGSFHFDEISSTRSALRGRTFAGRSESLLIDLDLRVFLQAIEQHLAKIARFLLAQRLRVLRAVLIDRFRIDLLLLEHLKHDRTLGNRHRSADR